MSYIIDCGKVMQDETTGEIYFEKRESYSSHKLIGRVTPADMGFKKEVSTKVYVYKTVQSGETLNDEIIYFDMTLTFTFPNERQYKNQFFYVAKSGRVFVRDFEAGVCSEASVNGELVSRSKARKLPENTLIPKNAPIYRLNSSGELEREINSEAVW